MEEREMIEIEETTAENEEANERSRMSTGTVLLIGAGLGLAVTAGVKFVRKKIAEHKAKKEQTNAIVVEASCSEVDDSESTGESK